MGNIGKHKGSEGEKGFTLVEMIVAVGLFAVVMLVSVSALLALVVANRKAQALQSVMNNLNASLDGMVRSIRMGSDYDGSQGCSTPIGNDCPEDGTTAFSFESYAGDTDNSNDQWVYWFEEGSDGKGRIYKSETSGEGGVPITAPTIDIDTLRFYVVGTDNDASDTIQPKVVIVIKGTAGASDARIKTNFAVQSTAVQRLLDL